MKKIFLFCASLFTVSSFHASAQLVNSMNISTGYDNTTSAVIPNGSQDPDWQITSVNSPFTASAPLPYPAYVQAPWNLGGSNNPTTPAGTGWISYSPTGMSVGVSDGGTGRMTIRFQFELCSADSVTIAAIMRSDNYISQIRVDGTATSFVQSNSTSSWTTGTPFNFSSTMTATVHYIEVDIVNSGATGNNPSGLDVSGTITSINNSIVDRDNYPNYVCAGSGQGSCDGSCYWTLTGNNISGTNNIFGTLNKNNVRITTNNVFRGTMDTKGQFGWNTMTPTAFLDVNCKGNNPDDGSAGSDVRFENLEKGTGTLLVIDQNGFVYNSGTTSTGGGGGINNACQTINTVPKVIDASGNLDCSQIYDDGNSVGIGTNTGILGGNFVYNTSMPGQGSLLGTLMPTPPAGLVKLDVNGVTRGIAFLAISDAKFKANLKEINNALAIVNLLSAKTYDWNDLARKSLGADNGRHIGFIAQELQKVIPEVVIQDEKGNYAVNYTELIPILAEGEKELYNLYMEEKNKNEQAISDLAAKVDELTNCCASSGKKTDIAATDGSRLYQNTPNPFNGETTIGYYVASVKTAAYVIIYDLNGKELNRYPVNAAGEGKVQVSSGDLQSGMYLYSLIVDGKEIDTKKMTLVK